MVPILLLLTAFMIGTQAAYLGCYKDDPLRRLPNSKGIITQMTPSVCIKNCLLEGSELAGMEYGNQCYCGPRQALYSATRLDEGSCNMACEGDTYQNCGGILTLSIYEAAARYAYRGGPSVEYKLSDDSNAVAVESSPENAIIPANPVAYVGCYQDNALRILKTLKTVEVQLTPAVCVEKCRVNGFELAGLEYGNQCYCGPSTALNLYAASKVDESRCQINCWGDNNQKCGGDWAIAIYQIST